MFISRREWEEKCDSNRALLKDKAEKTELIEKMNILIEEARVKIARLEEELKHKDIPFYEYRNEDYEAKTKQQFLEDGDMKKLVRSIYNSEGQEIKFNFSLQVDKLGQFIKNSIQSNHTEVFVLMDGMDSGLSIDGIDEI